MNRAVGYYRYSSDKQDADSIEAQRRACAAYATAHGYTIVAEHVDEALSGKGSKTASRAAYQRMLRDASKGLFETIIVHKYDRVARSLYEHVTLAKRLHDLGITLIAAAQDFGDSNEAIITKGIMWILSEYYSINLASETMKGLKETALKGLHCGGVPPFGFDVVGQQYVINALEAAYVRKIFDAAANREGFTAIIDELDAAGIRGKRGKPIKYTQIYEMLRNEKYTGTFAYSQSEEKNRADRRTKPNAIRIENALPAIIDRAKFEGVQRIMSVRRQTGKKAGYLCRGLVYCTCGAKMHGSSPEKNGKIYRHYRCSARCGFGTVRVEDVDASATGYLRELLTDENQFDIAMAIKGYQAASNDWTKDFKTITKRKVSEKQNQYDALMANLSSAALPPSVVADVGTQMETLQGEMEALRNAEPPKDYSFETIEAWLNSIKEAPDEKAVHILIERIDVINKTDFNITSTLKSVLRETGCGGGI